MNVPPPSDGQPSNPNRDHVNALAAQRIIDSKPFLVDIKQVGEILPELGQYDVLHAGPPLSGWDEATDVLKGSILGALVHTGLVADLQEAELLSRSGSLNLLSASDHQVAATYAGVITRRTPVFVVENRVAGTVALTALNEGRGKALRYGSNDAQTLEHLGWIEGELARILGTAVRASGGIDLFAILSQALHMGDEGHSRQKAASALFASIIAPHLCGSGHSPEEIMLVMRTLAENEIFFLPLAMAACKATMEAAKDVSNSTIVTCMCTNGVRFGIKISGAGEEWFTAPVPEVRGQYFKGFKLTDATSVIGDSEIIETMGLGAFAMAAAPALARYVGGTFENATKISEGMYAITTVEHPEFTLPALNFRGVPLGIDTELVVRHSIEPVFSTGIAHRNAGAGQIGAGFGRVPLQCFAAALEYVDKKN